MSARSEQIIEIAHECKEVIPDGSDDNIVECVEDCTGFHLSSRERKLALIAFDEPETARRSIHYYR